MALRNAFGELATDETLKDGTQRTKVIPGTSGGLSIYRNINLGASGRNIKSSAGQIYGWFLFNRSASVRYIKLYNKSSAPSVGLDTPIMTIPLPAGAGANVNFTSGISFTRGVGIGATTGVSDNNTGAPAANEVLVNIIYY